MGVPRVRVVAVDVGSVTTSRFAWVAWDCSPATGDGPATEILEADAGRDPAGVPDIISAALHDGHLVALGMECPLLLPVPAAWQNLGKGRIGEPGRAWSAAAGASSMATGLAQLAWLLSEVAARADVRATTQPGRWSTDTPLLLWEAFVSGATKTDRGPDGHITDARAAARGFVSRIHRLLAADASDVHVGDHRAFNLAAAAALHAELRIEPDELAGTLLVISAAIASGGAR
ncbi:MAG: hypothetical protein ACRDT6_02040 [Micromonosporaceae bacterium]